MSELREVAPHSAEGILVTAASYVGGDRAKTHGDKGVNFRTTGILHEALDAAEREAGASLSPALKYALRMILAKMSRILTGAHNLDDYIDIAGYAACAGEVADQEARPRVDDGEK